jgi:hypothetical protein
MIRSQYRLTLRMDFTHNRRSMIINEDPSTEGYQIDNMIHA